jgi:hypothetical protein
MHFSRFFSLGIPQLTGFFDQRQLADLLLGLLCQDFAFEAD